jgi:galactonate dehydratase
VRITGISTHVVGTPWRNLTYVQVHTDEGITGVGETRMLGHTDALIGYLREAETNHILGSDPFAVEDLVRRMKYGDYGRAGEIVMSGIAVVEMACWDIKGKALGVPERSPTRSRRTPTGGTPPSGRRRRTTRPPRGSWSADTRR